FKCNVLWTQLDALYFAYVAPGMIPPDAWTPGIGLVPEAPGAPRAAGTGRIEAAHAPRLPRGVRMRFDETRQKHVLLAPERTFDLDDNAVAVLSLVDGSRTVSDIANTLGETYAADPKLIEADILVMLNDLATKRVLER
ncbi:pyrroloquinoline quinone biosynthesis peptide chaperone PqqD, partial [Methylobacterium nigriterrae]|uniref:pyrroloquinoline quinone biosynthesis peptide chaperone PqqD n=1 Tax=Methylobacterium nigriterrae TaxID=3127512 RepID=UPI0030138230